MDEFVQTLKEIGLQEKEADIYLALIQIGSNPASTIAKKAGQHRGTCYTNLEKLIRKGFVQQIIKDNISYFTAIKPKFILDKIKTRHYRLEEKVENLYHLLNQFKTPANLDQKKSKVFFYEGEEGIQNIMEDTLTTKDTLRAYASYDELLNVLPNYFPQYYQKRIKKGIFVKAIYPSSPESIKQQQRDKKELRESRLIQKEYDFHLDILMYDNKIAVTSLKEKFAIMIDNESIAKAQKKIFDIIWDSLEPVNK